MRFGAMVAAVGLVFATPSAAQANDVVTAKQPAGMVIAMLNAGYDAELATDDLGDPLIKSEIAGYPLRIYFYDCNEDTHEDCGSIQLVTGFDRKRPWTADAAVKFANGYRFAAVSLDGEGDPYLRWDIVTDDGIPTRVFVKGLRLFEETVRVAAEIVFADEQDSE